MDIFQPTDELKNLIDNHLPNKTYTAIHYRLGDNCLNKNSHIFETLLNRLHTQYVKNQDIFFTDSNTFRKFLKERKAFVLFVQGIMSRQF